MAIFPRMVGKDQLQAGNAILRSTQQLSSIVGAAPAGLIIAAAGTAVAFGVDAVSFFVATLTMALMNEAGFINLGGEPSGPPKKMRLSSLFGDVKEGFGFACAPPARAVLLSVALVDFAFAGPLDVGLAWLSDNVYVGGAAAFGTILASFGAGALAGSILAGSFRLRRRGIVFVVLSVVLGVGMGLLGFITSLVPASVDAAVVGIGVGLFGVNFVSWLQTTTIGPMMGRVMSLVSFASVGLARFPLPGRAGGGEIHPAMFSCGRRAIILGGHCAANGLKTCGRLTDGIFKPA